MMWTEYWRTAGGTALKLKKGEQRGYQFYTYYNPIFSFKKIKNLNSRLSGNILTWNLSGKHFKLDFDYVAGCDKIGKSDTDFTKRGVIKL